MDQHEPASLSAPVPAAMDRGQWVLFDGDNTLWHIEGLYDHARRELVKFISEYGADPREIEAFQRREDARLFSELGYSAARFGTSFENTVRQFIPNATTAQFERAIQVALSVFERPANIDPDAPAVLGGLRRSHHLALVTAGEHWVQERRVSAFPWAGLFDAVRIVERKTPELFRDLAKELAIDVARSWVVGDSLRSDVIPALKAGLSAILIANHNWVEVERDEMQPGNLVVVDRLRDVLPLIAAAEREIPAPAHP